MFKDELIPPIYAKDGPRPLHDDWTVGSWLPAKYQPWTRIPRTFNFFGFDMGPKIWKASEGVKERPIEVQPGYPIAPDCEIFEENGRQYFYGVDPILPPGEAAIVSAYLPVVGRVPAFITFTLDFGTHYVPVYFGFKNDCTFSTEDPNQTKNFSYWFEGSVSVRRKR